MRKLLWITSLICAFVATIMFYLTLVGARSAPQEAAGCAIALALAVIPFIAARAWDEISKK